MRFMGAPSVSDSKKYCQEGADRLFAAVTSGKVNINVNQTFALADCAEAHRQLEARETTGSTILKI